MQPDCHYLSEPDELWNRSKEYVSNILEWACEKKFGHRQIDNIPFQKLSRMSMKNRLRILPKLIRCAREEGKRLKLWEDLVLGYSIPQILQLATYYLYCSLGEEEIQTQLSKAEALLFNDWHRARTGQNAPASRWKEMAKLLTKFHYYRLF
jgi:hypothetical protein